MRLILETWRYVAINEDLPLNSSFPGQNGHTFPDSIFNCIFLNENVWILIKISPKFVPEDPVNDITALVQIMTWCRPGTKPLSEPMIVYWCIYASLGLNELKNWFFYFRFTGKWQVLDTGNPNCLCNYHNLPNRRTAPLITIFSPLEAPGAKPLKGGAYITNLSHGFKYSFHEGLPTGSTKQGVQRTTTPLSP